MSLKQVLKEVVQGVVNAPLNLILIPLALTVIALKCLLNRYNSVESGLKKVIPITLKRRRQRIKNKQIKNQGKI